MKKLIYIIIFLVLALSITPVAGCSKTEEADLIEACIQGNLEDAEMLIKNGADVNERDDTSWTPLMIAAEYGYDEVAQMLIDNGANIDEKDNKGWTAIMNAAKMVIPVV